MEMRKYMHHNSIFNDGLISCEMKRILFLPVILLFSSGLYSQGVYNNGGKIVVGTGITMFIYGKGGNYRNETNVKEGSIDLSGNLIINGDLINNSPASDIFGTIAQGSEVAFTGTAIQTIGGSTGSSFTFADLIINNISGVVVLKDAFVTGAMSFINGLVDIGNNNLIFGASSHVSGTPTSSNMIVATGSGMVYREWTSPGAFTFPVGDKDAVAVYSPVSLNFTTGTFDAGAFAGVNLVALKYSDPAITGSYLNRYWNVSYSGITGFTADAEFKYVDSDISGSEADIYTFRVNPLPLASFDQSNSVLHLLTAKGLTSLGTFTGGPGTATVIEGLFTKNALTLSNYPNPFARNTMLVYSLPMDGRVTLTIRNLEGQIVKTIVSRMDTKGDYSMNINTSDLISGVYLATLSLRTNGNELLRTIRLLKVR
jgi:hypothetical protein